jgi:general secretion pathway protein G
MALGLKGKRGKGGAGRGNGPRRPPAPLPLSPSGPASSSGGWTLIELIITITVLTVLTLGVIPIVRNSVRRQKEVRLREALREMRGAIDAFKRDTVGMQCGPLGGGAGPVVPVVPVQPNQPGGPGQPYVDPRSRVVMADCTIFGVDNPDRYPPSLETLVDGVDVIPRGGLGGAIPGAGLGNDNRQATDNPALAAKKKVYLREIPVDPITGERDWCLRSSYDPADGGCESAPENVFDVSSKSNATALNGEKYSEW